MSGRFTAVERGRAVGAGVLVVHRGGSGRQWIHRGRGRRLSLWDGRLLRPYEAITEGGPGSDEQLHRHSSAPDTARALGLIGAGPAPVFPGPGRVGRSGGTPWKDGRDGAAPLLPCPPVPRGFWSCIARWPAVSIRIGDRYRSAFHHHAGLETASLLGGLARRSWKSGFRHGAFVVYRFRESVPSGYRLSSSDASFRPLLMRVFQGYSVADFASCSPSRKQRGMGRPREKSRAGAGGRAVLEVRGFPQDPPRIQNFPQRKRPTRVGWPCAVGGGGGNRTRV